MRNRLLFGGIAATAAGAAMVAISSAPASAITLSAPSIAPQVAGADVDKVWWDRWGYWHPGPGWGWGWGWGWGPGPWYYHPHRHCWVGRWGRLHCGWW